MTAFIPTAIASLLCIHLVIRLGARNVLTYASAFYLLFAFGPIVAFNFGLPIYEGVITRFLPMSAWMCMVAMLGLYLAAMLSKVTIPQNIVDVRDREFFLLPVLYVAVTTYAAYAVLQVGPALVVDDKQARIAALGSGLHYAFLSLCTATACSKSFAAGSRRNNFLYYMGLAAFALYCVSTGERDFLFVGFALWIHWAIYRGKPLGRKWIIALGTATAMFAVYLASGRSGRFQVEDVLTQGSNVFVNTVVAAYSEGSSLLLGESYWNSILGLVSLDSAPTLSNWLVSIYAPGSIGSTGYGFSLEAEAWLNFGWVGIFCVFFALALAQARLQNAYPTSRFARFFSPFFLAVFLYGLRGESYSLLQSLLNGLLFYFVVTTLSVPIRKARNGATGRISGVPVSENS